MKKIILGLIVLMTSFVSCMDQEAIEIKYKSNMSITAKHLFDSFTPVLENDFAMHGVNGDWNINLRAFIYDDNGELIKKVEEQYPDLSNTLTFDLDLLPGKYSLVSIADFTGIWNGTDQKYWKITNETNIKDLSIEQNSELLNTAFGTLGVCSKEFEIFDCVENILIDIKPVTGLLQTMIWDQTMVEGTGVNGFSVFAPFCEKIEINAPSLKQIVRFEGINPTYKFGPQAYDYHIMTHSPRTQYEENKAKQVIGYRALLPIENCDFYWECYASEGSGEILFGPGYNQDYQVSEKTTKINVESGKQYAMDLLLDGMYLFVENHNPAIDTFDRVQSLIDRLNSDAFNQIMDRNFDTFIDLSKATVENTFGLGLNYGNSLYYFSYNKYLNYLYFDFDELTGKVKTIGLIFNYINDDFRKRMTEYLTNRFNVYEKATDSHYKAFIDGPDLQSSKIGITWNLDQDVLVYTTLNK